MKGQIAITDLFVAGFIFLILFIAIIITWNGYSTNLDNSINFEDITITNFLLSEQLVNSQGNPSNWNETNVKVIGLLITDNKTLSNEKVNSFKLLDYELAKSLMNIKGFDFLFKISALNGSIMEEIGVNDTLNSTLVNSVRYIFYNGEKSVVEFAIWQ